MGRPAMIVALLNQALFAQQGLLRLLGQTPRLERANDNLRFYLTALAIAFIVIAVVAAIARKYLAGGIESDDGEAIFDLSELRQQHRDGQLTDDEYLAARAAALNVGGTYLGNDLPRADPGADPTPRPAGGAGVDLGPELLDTSKTTPKTPEESDNSDDAPPADDTEPKD